MTWSRAMARPGHWDGLTWAIEAQQVLAMIFNTSSAYLGPYTIPIAVEKVRCTTRLRKCPDYVGEWRNSGRSLGLGRIFGGCRHGRARKHSVGTRLRRLSTPLQHDTTWLRIIHPWLERIARFYLYIA